MNFNELHALIITSWKRDFKQAMQTLRLVVKVSSLLMQVTSLSQAGGRDVTDDVAVERQM